MWSLGRAVAVDLLDKYGTLKCVLTDTRDTLLSMQEGVRCMGQSASTDYIEVRACLT